MPACGWGPPSENESLSGLADYPPSLPGARLGALLTLGGKLPPTKGCTVGELTRAAALNPGSTLNLSTETSALECLGPPKGLDSADRASQAPGIFQSSLHLSNVQQDWEPLVGRTGVF